MLLAFMCFVSHSVTLSTFLTEIPLSRMNFAHYHFWIHSRKLGRFGRFALAAILDPLFCTRSSYTSTYHKFCRIIKKHSPTILGWLNIHRSKYETYPYKENVHTDKKNAVSLPLQHDFTSQKSRFITKFIQTTNLNRAVVFHFPSQHSRFIT